jgi:hypothetical protein
VKKFPELRKLSAIAILAIAFMPSGEACRVRHLAEFHDEQADQKGRVQEFKGKVVKSDGRFMLEESSDGGNYGTYLLDDQAAAKKYEGQRVVVTGTLDAPHNTIHVQKIEAVA